MGFMARRHEPRAALAEVAVRAPIDRVHLARYTMGNLALEIEILGLFAGQAPSTFAELKEAQTDKAWRDAAHTLKGSARAVGAWRVAERAEQAEALTSAADELVRHTVLQALHDALAQSYAYIGSLDPRG